MIYPGRNSWLIAITFAARQTIDFRFKQVYMFRGHFRRAMYFTRIAARARTLVMIVAHLGQSATSHAWSGRPAPGWWHL
jgi:hypothetical protein